MVIRKYNIACLALACAALALGACSSAPDLTEITLDFELVASDIDSPVVIASAGDGSGRLFIGSQRGIVYTLEDGNLLPDPFLNIREIVDSSENERGLLGMAFHPDYASNGLFFVDYTNRDGNTVVARYSVSSDPNVADPTSARIVLEVSQPARNHNGGHLAFGPDGYLYIGFGDGGGSNDQYGNGQRPDTMLGTLVRIDVDGGDPYAIPPDNPFADGSGGLPEVWAYGLRNPWRFSFDRSTGDLYIADVGQGHYEEIDFQPAGSAGGQNYGWNITEGALCFGVGEDECDRIGLTPPIAGYTHEEDSCAITGGYVYRGRVYRSLRGAYIFGDYCSGAISGMVMLRDGTAQVETLAETGFSITTFGEDDAGELYVADREGGIYRIIVR